MLGHAMNLCSFQTKVKLHILCSGSFCKDYVQLITVALHVVSNAFPLWNIKKLH